MIHKSGNLFVISKHGVWFPGAYANAEAARRGHRFTYEQLKEIRDSIGGRAIETGDLKPCAASPR